MTYHHLSWSQDISIFNDKLSLPDYEFSINHSIHDLNDKTIKATLTNIENAHGSKVASLLIAYRDCHQMADWFYYQIIRRTAQFYSPKQKDYYAYTLMKYYLLRASGYQPRLLISDAKLLMFIRSDQDVYDIPYYEHKGSRYICLNAHDYGVDKSLNNMPLIVYQDDAVVGTRLFSYTITHIPDFPMGDYQEKQLKFYVKGKQEHVAIKINPQLNSLLNNYPTISFSDYFNAPLNKLTREQLISFFKNKTKRLSTVDGINILLDFCRTAFAYETDQAQYGREKRMIAEQTMLSDKSDCDDRAALFYYLVKEIYGLPMIVIVYPSHINVAVAMELNKGDDYIIYKGKKYLICEPTPQGIELPVGTQHPKHKGQSYEIAFEYMPENN